MAMKPLTAQQVVAAAPVIPVIVLHDVAHAVPLARALVAGGIPMLEVTLRTPQGLACMEAIAREVPEAVVGAGTVRSADDVRAVQAAGARFVVSPGFGASVSEACRAAQLALLPGVATGSEIMAAADAGWKVLKFFPAVQAGGLAMLQAWSGPFGDIRFCPTGGVNASNAPDFLKLPNVACVGGSWLVPNAALQNKDWAQIEALAREAAQLHRP